MYSASLLYHLPADVIAYARLLLQSSSSQAAEILFLRKQLALYQECNVPRNPTDLPTRITIALLSNRFHWRDALAIVQPKTLIRWHRLGFRLFWRYKSRPGRPRIPLELRQLIQQMALNNVCWGEERIAKMAIENGNHLSPTPFSRLQILLCTASFTKNLQGPTTLSLVVNRGPGALAP